MLRLVVETATDWVAAFVPSAPATEPVDYCRTCGALRLKPEKLELLRLAEVKAEADREAGVDETGPVTREMFDYLSRRTAHDASCALMQPPKTEPVAPSGVHPRGGRRILEPFGSVKCSCSLRRTP